MRVIYKNFAEFLRAQHFNSPVHQLHRDFSDAEEKLLAFTSKENVNKFKLTGTLLRAFLEDAGCTKKSALVLAYAKRIESSIGMAEAIMRTIEPDGNHD